MPLFPGTHFCETVPQIIVKIHGGAFAALCRRAVELHQCAAIDLCVHTAGDDG